MLLSAWLYFSKCLFFSLLVSHFPPTLLTPTALLLDLTPHLCLHGNLLWESADFSIPKSTSSTGLLNTLPNPLPGSRKWKESTERVTKQNKFYRKTTIFPSLSWSHFTGDLRTCQSDVLMRDFGSPVTRGQRSGVWVPTVAGRPGCGDSSSVTCLVSQPGSWSPSFLLEIEMVSQLWGQLPESKCFHGVIGSNSHCDPAP